VPATTADTAAPLVPERKLARAEFERDLAKAWQRLRPWLR
jgi:hypothetical protein